MIDLSIQGEDIVKVSKSKKAEGEEVDQSADNLPSIEAMKTKDAAEK